MRKMTPPRDEATPRGHPGRHATRKDDERHEGKRMTMEKRKERKRQHRDGDEDDDDDGRQPVA